MTGVLCHEISSFQVIKINADVVGVIWIIARRAGCILPLQITPVLGDCGILSYTYFYTLSIIP
jgi:hypothetical protein